MAHPTVGQQHMMIGVWDLFGDLISSVQRLTGGEPLMC